MLYKAYLLQADLSTNKRLHLNKRLVYVPLCIVCKIE